MCSHPRPYYLRPRDRALVPCVLSPCAYMQRQRQETNKQAMKGKDAKCIQRRHKANKHDRHGKQSTRKQANKREDKQKVVSMRDKCRFGSNVHNFIVLKYGRHTNK